MVDETRRLRIPFVGHCPDNISITEASKGAGRRGCLDLPLPPPARGG